MSEINTEFRRNYQIMSDFKGFPELPKEETFIRSVREKKYFSKVIENMKEANLDPMVLPVPNISFNEWQIFFGNSSEQSCLQASRKATRKLDRISKYHAERSKRLGREKPTTSQNNWRAAIISREIIGIYLGDDSMQQDEYNKIKDLTGVIGANDREQLGSATPSVNMYLAAQLLERSSNNPKMHGSVLLRDRKLAGEPLRFMAEANDQLLDKSKPAQIAIGTFASRNASLGIMLGVEFEH